MKRTTRVKPPEPAKPSPKPKTITKTKTVTKKVFVHKLTVAQLDSLGLRLAAVPISNKDRELIARTLIDELDVKDTDRFYKAIRETEVATPKT